MLELTEEELEAFRLLNGAMGAAAEEFVIVGGQASRLLRLHPDARTLNWPPVLTSDIDVATRLRGHTTTVNLGKSLDEAGFKPDFRDHSTPPVTHYRRGVAEIEFIVPTAKERHPSGPVVELFGINAQKVDNLDLVLEEPTCVELQAVGTIRVPIPRIHPPEDTDADQSSAAREERQRCALHSRCHATLHGWRTASSAVATASETPARHPPEEPVHVAEDELPQTQ